MLKSDPQELHLFVADFDDFDPVTVAARHLEHLNSAERQRYQRYQLDRHRHRFLLGRALLRQTLSRYHATAPGDWVITDNSYGKPGLDLPTNAPPLSFNLSHSGSRLLIVIGGHETLGVDIERSNKSRRFGKIAGRYFSSAEVAAMQQLPASEQKARFYQLWTLKEAYIKARGLGLALGLQNFSFSFPAVGEIDFAVVPALQDEPEAWQFWQFPCGNDYQAALALNTGEQKSVSVKLWQLTEPGSALPLPLRFNCRKPSRRPVCPDG